MNEVFSAGCLQTKISNQSTEATAGLKKAGSSGTYAKHDIHPMDNDTLMMDTNVVLMHGFVEEMIVKKLLQEVLERNEMVLWLGQPVAFDDVGLSGN